MLRYTVPLTNCEGADKKSYPDWIRSILFDEEKKRILLPLAVFGNEQAIMLSMAYDGALWEVSHKHIYGDSDWLLQKYPKESFISEWVKLIKIQMEKNQCSS